ncbi:hypothetical protein [Kiloniella majae]|uniref:hypothetical protein n=1 Tax=Kiloniella majae TaxID=1938558 RepID=UPI000A2790F8|nr:hypothetical protein [Kiloniella majae]
MTKTKPRFIHVGYPKCASTTLQYDIFYGHPEIYHLGWGNLSTGHGWIDEELAAAFEVDLRMAKTHQYDITPAKNALEKHFKIFEQISSYKTIGLSWESLCFTLAYDVDPVIKASRLLELFGRETKIVFVIRNQFELIRSMYFEMVRDGLSKTFEEYLEYLHFHPYASLTGDLDYTRMVKIFGERFGLENILIIPFESLIADKDFYIKKMCHFVGASQIDLALGQHNPSTDLRKLENWRLYNAEHRYNFGDEAFSFLDAHKYTSYWKREGKALSANAAAAIEAQPKALIEADSTFTGDTSEIKAEFSSQYIRIFTELYGKSNQDLARTWELDLERYAYPM